MGKGKTSGMVSLTGKTTRKMKSLGHHVISQETYKPKGKSIEQLVKQLTKKESKMHNFLPSTARLIGTTRRFTYYEIKITPEHARQFLRKNEGNRNVSNMHMKHISLQMQLDRWVQVPCSIILSEGGNVIDGQHRLEGIVDSGIPQEMIVVVAKHSEEIFQILDQGKGRTNADILRMPNQIVQPIQYLLRCHGMTKPVASDIREYDGTHLMTACVHIHETIKPKTKGIVSAPFRASFAVATAMGANFAASSEVFQALGSYNVKEFTPLMADLMKQFNDGFMKQDGRSINNEFFMRGVFMFLNNHKAETVRIYSSFRNDVKRTTEQLMHEWRNDKV